MKDKTLTTSGVISQFVKLFVLIICTTQFMLAQNSHEDKSQSPYFHVTSGGAKVEEFPLVSTSAAVNIVGPIADVKVTQVYRNDGNMPIEAIYVFPGSTRAAVYQMTMTIGDRVINAEIQEKKEARKTYERAKSQGKRASLLEQHRPNVFQMNVANICPGDEIKVELYYNEFLIPESKVYSFIYPTVVGPRFVANKEAKTANGFLNLPYLKEKKMPPYNFDISLNINGGMKLQECNSPSHKIDVQYTSANTAVVKLDQSEKKGGNRDFIYNYSLAGGQIAQGTMLYEHEDENFFLSVIEPPSKVNEGYIPPREYVFVVDVSGSMNGFPLDVSKTLMKNLVAKLRPTDRFNVLLFASSSSILAASSLIANTENLNKAFRFLDSPEGGGGTRLLPALRRALALPASTKVNSRSIIVVTDGYVNVERDAFHLISKNLNKSNLFAFGIGSSVNRHLIEGMAHAGRGEAFIITEKKYAGREAERFRKYIQEPILTNISVEFEGLDTYDVIPASIPDLLSERPIYLFGKYKGKARGNIKITGLNGQERFNSTIPVISSLLSKHNGPLRYLWAREKIRWLDDLNSLSATADDVKALTELGLKYNLLTKYTSFVAVDEEPVLANGEKTKTVKQAVPLPEGVSNYAVGFELAVDGETAATSVIASKVFALVTGTVPEKIQTALKSTIEKSIIFTSQEKGILNGNTLHLNYDFQNNTWTMKDERGLLPKSFIDQFVKLINEMYVPRGVKDLVTISLVWI